MKAFVLRVVASLFVVPPLRGVLCWRGPRAVPAVALTFDDGPHEDTTRGVLRILRGRGVRATFFLLGRELAKWPEGLQEIRADGHAVGIHGYDHRVSDLRGQTERCRKLLARQRIATWLLRPPAGRLGLRGLLWARSQGYATVLWSFDAHDSMRHEGKWPGPDPEFGKIRAGDIILMHDDNPVCLNDLPGMIDAVEANGLRFVTAPELLGLPTRDESATP